MKSLRDYIGIAAVLTMSTTACTTTRIEPRVPPVYVEDICSPDPSGEYDTVCEADFNDNGISEKRFYDEDNNLMKEVEGDKITRYFYSEECGLAKKVIGENEATNIFELCNRKKIKDSYDLNSDGNPEETFIYEKNGTVTFKGDQNSDANYDLISRTDDEGNVHLQIDTDLNGKIDTHQSYFYNENKELVKEVKGLDKNEDGEIDIIYRRFYEKGNFVKGDVDYDNDGVIDDEWFSEDDPLNVAMGPVLVSIPLKKTGPSL